MADALYLKCQNINHVYPPIIIKSGVWREKHKAAIG